MTNLDTILDYMTTDKNIKTVSLQFKRTTSGIKVMYETRIGDETKMGMEFVGTKDLEKKGTALREAKETVLVEAVSSCQQSADEVK